jgi:nicotinamidase-related amidase
MRVLLENTAAMIIDYQEKIMPAMWERDQLLRNSIQLIKGLKILEIPRYITSQYTKGLGMNLPEIFEAAGTKKYMDKMTFSSYDTPEIKEALGNERKNIILCGIEAHVCVLQTAIDLKAAGFLPILVTNCISSRRESDKEIALIRAQQEGIILTTSEAILFELTRKAGDEKFKQISKLVK